MCVNSERVNTDYWRGGRRMHSLLRNQKVALQTKVMKTIFLRHFGNTFWTNPTNGSGLFIGHRLNSCKYLIKKPLEKLLQGSEGVRWCKVISKRWEWVLFNNQFYNDPHTGGRCEPLDRNWTMHNADVIGVRSASEADKNQSFVRTTVASHRANRLCRRQQYRGQDHITVKVPFIKKREQQPMRKNQTIQKVLGMWK